MKKAIIFIAATLLTITAVSAQNYKWAGGVRIGGDQVGATVKHKFNSSSAVEAIFSYPWDNGFNITGLYERHIPVISQGFNFYYGFGGHIGSWDHDFAIGVDGIVGLEYKLPMAPIAFSVDYKPTFNIASHTHFYMADIALGIKYTF